MKQTPYKEPTKIRHHEIYSPRRTGAHDLCTPETKQMQNWHYPFKP